MGREMAGSNRGPVRGAGSRGSPSAPAPRRARAGIAVPGAGEEAAKAAERNGRDSPASLCLEPGNRWNPMIDAISTYINGAWASFGDPIIHETAGDPVTVTVSDLGPT